MRAGDVLPGVATALGDMFRTIGEHGPAVKLIMTGLMLAIVSTVRVLGWAIEAVLVGHRPAGEAREARPAALVTAGQTASTAVLALANVIPR